MVFNIIRTTCVYCVNKLQTKYYVNNTLTLKQLKLILLEKHYTFL